MAAPLQHQRSLTRLVHKPKPAVNSGAVNTTKASAVNRAELAPHPSTARGAYPDTDGRRAYMQEYMRKKANGTGMTDEELEEANLIFDALPPEVVRQMFIDILRENDGRTEAFRAPGKERTKCRKLMMGEWRERNDVEP